VSKKVHDAISSLAELQEGWALLADTIPEVFLREVKAKIQSLRIRNANLLTALKEADEHACEVCECPCGGGETKGCCEHQVRLALIERAEKDAEREV